jgi:hypothetical protein
MNTAGILCQAQNRIYFSCAPLFPFSKFSLFFYFIFLRLPIFLVLTTGFQGVHAFAQASVRGQLVKQLLCQL